MSVAVQCSQFLKERGLTFKYMYVLHNVCAVIMEGGSLSKVLHGSACIHVRARIHVHNAMCL